MRTLLIALLALAAALAAASAFPLCGGACGNPWIALAGAAFYGGALVAAIAWGPTRLLACALLMALGAHVGLLSTGLACGFCWACAGISALVTALLVLDCGVCLPAIPAAAAAAVLVMPIMKAPFHDEPARTLVVYEQDDCPYCEELRERVLPEATRGLDVAVRFRPIEPWVRATPTIIVGRRVLSGLPTSAELRRAIVEEFRP